VNTHRLPALLATGLLALLLSGCSGQSLVNAALAPPGSTPVPSIYSVVVNTPGPTATPVVIVPRPLAVNVARLSVKPGEQQEIDVTGTPDRYVNIIVRYANGDRFNDATRIGAQLDINGTYVDKWTVYQYAPGGSVTVAVQDVTTGQMDQESFLIDATPWGGAAPVGNPPIIGYVPYGTPGAGLVMASPTPATSPVPSPFPFAGTTPLPGQTVAGNLQVQASPSTPRIPVGGTIRINGTLTDGGGQGVAGARLFAIGHFPGGHSEVWVSPAQSGPNGLVWVSAPITGVTAGSVIQVDVYMTYNGQSYHGQTSFQVG
jgi:hypothetical protein